MTRHALVVGGTGMLRGVSLHLAGRFDAVSVVARGAGRLKRLAGRAEADGGHIHTIRRDYRNTDALAADLEAACEQFGRVDVAVCWIHATALGALEAVARHLVSTAAPCRLFHVLGSASADPSRDDASGAQVVSELTGIDYRRVVLGFVIEDERSRWLTHAEISSGVIEAIEADLDTHIVGTVRPWSARPGA